MISAIFFLKNIKRDKENIIKDVIKPPIGKIGGITENKSKAIDPIAKVKEDNKVSKPR
jgi:hypothetical protein